MNLLKAKPINSLRAFTKMNYEQMLINQLESIWHIKLKSQNQQQIQKLNPKQQMWQEVCSWLRGSKQKVSNNQLRSGKVKPSIDQIYWFECIGMFIFVFLQTCTKQPTGIHLQITFILMVAIPMCAKISGAHYNPAVTVSNYLCRFNHNPFSVDIMWMYFKAQFYSATFAFALGYILNDHFLPGLALPHDQVSSWRILLSELLATGILVFYTQLAANSQTSFAIKDGQKYCFIIVFVFVARKSAYVSSFAINPAITMATLVMDVITCRYMYLHICAVYLIGDFLGAILGTYFYNTFYVNNLNYSRTERQNSHNSSHRSIQDVEMQELVSPNVLSSEERLDSNRQEQSAGYSRNFLELDKALSSNKENR